MNFAFSAAFHDSSAQTNMLTALVSVLLCLVPLVASAPNLTSSFTTYPSTGMAPSARAYFDGDVENSRMIYSIYSGTDGPFGVGAILNDIWTFNLVTGLWSVLPLSGTSIKAARSGTIGGSLSAIGNQLYIYGGQNSATIYGDTLAITSGLNTMSSQPFSINAPIPRERTQHLEFSRTSPKDGVTRMYIYGGKSQSNYISDIWEYTPYQFPVVGPLNNNTGGLWRQLCANCSLASTPPGMTRMNGEYVASLDSLFIWHGMRDPLFGDSSPSTEMWVFNMTTETWSKNDMWLSVLNKPFPAILDSCTWDYNGYLYMVGGIDPITQTFFNSSYRLNFQVRPYIFETFTYALNSSLKQTGWIPRAGHECRMIPSLPAFGYSTPGVLIFGGLTAQEVTNEMIFYDSLTNSMNRIMAPSLTPTARCFHITSLVGKTVFLFGGQDAYGNKLGDLWGGSIQINAVSGDVTDIAWSSITPNSVLNPSARSKHASASLLGQMFVFGGLGVTAGSTATILSDLWSYRVNGNLWTQLQCSGSIPAGRYGHSLNAVDSLLYLFGGITSAGQSSELWTFDQTNCIWTQITPAFTGAMWPVRKAFHSSALVSDFVTAADLPVYSSYASNMYGYARLLLSSFANTSYPTPLNAANDPVWEFSTAVNASIAQTISAVNSITEGTMLSFLVVYGGMSADLGFSVSGDIFIFDLLTQLWSIPGNYNALTQFAARKMHVASAFGPTLVVHGGQDDSLLSPGSPSYIQLDVNSDSGFSYPYTKFARSQKLIGSVSDAVDSSSAMSLSAAMLLSMPPAVITITVPQWRYFNGSDWTIGSVVNKSLQFPRGSAWGVLGMMAGHSNVQLSDSMLYFGGFTYRDDSNVPVPTPNNVYMRVTRSRISPVCSTTVATASPLYAISGGFRQDSKTSDSTGSCLVCIAGSYFNTTKQTCEVCSPGFYSPVDQSLICTPCAAGFYSTSFGGNAISSCAPCASGTYQPLTGQSSCIPCASTAFCPAGSAAPIVSTTAVPFSQTQPQPMIDAQAIVNLVVYFVLIAGFGASLLVSLVFIFVYKLEACRRRIPFTGLDLVFNSHHQPWTRVAPKHIKSRELWREFYIESWPTLLGGWCSALFFFFTVTNALFLMLPFQFGNIAESRSLLPAAAIDPFIRSSYRTDLTLLVNFVIYGQNCQAVLSPVNVWGSCDSSINITLASMRPDVANSKFAQCKFDPTTSTCFMQVVCLGCQILSDSSAVRFTMSQTLSFAESIAWNLTTTSGIQSFGSNYAVGGQISQLLSQINAPTGKIFRGSTASLVSVDLYPTSYTPSVYSLTPGTGYMVQFAQQSAGSTTTPSLFSISQGLRFTVALTRQQATFVTNQVAILSPEATFAQVVGLTVAAFLVLRFFMRSCENWLEKPINWAVFHDTRLVNFDEPEEVKQTGTIVLKATKDPKVAINMQEGDDEEEAAQ